MFFKQKAKGPHKDILQPFRRLYAKWHGHHEIYRDVLTYDEARQRYIINRVTVTRDEVAPDDLPITGEKWRFFRTDLTPPYRQEKRTEVIDGVEVEFLNPSAISYNLYYESNVINEALAGEFKPKLMNPLILAVLIVGGVAVLFWFLMG